MSSDDVDAKVMGLTLEIDDSSRSGFGKLPTELLYHIIRLAASTDQRTAHACAYVSKLVCRWTAPDRWRTIICTSGDQLDALWFLLEVQLAKPAVDLPNDVKRFTSLPSLQPGAFVENLFIDTSDAAYTLADILAEQADKIPCMATSCPHLNSQNKLTCGEGHRPHEVQDILRHFPFVSYLALGHMEASNLRLDTVSPVKLLCTAENEGLLTHTIDQMGPYLSNDFEDPPHVDDALWRADGSRIWKPSLESFRRRLNSVHIVAIDLINKISGVTMPTQAIETLRSGSFGQLSFVRRIADHQAGGPPPRLSLADQEDSLASEWYIWPTEDRKGERRYTRGSDPPSASSSAGPETEKARKEADKDDGLHPFDNEYSAISSKSWNAFQQGVTKIRYDTRKFAFRPCEITASRLKPFFEELTTTGVESTEMNGDGANTSTTSFTHSGPRHAAPHRGAGHYSKPDPGSQSDRTNLTAKQAALSTFGCSKFETLHLCWDPVPGTDDNGGKTVLKGSSDAQNSSPSTGAGGDTDWPVERQDIWTNTLSQNNEAQAPPPHTHQNGGTRATPSRSTSSPPPAIATTQRSSWAIPSSIESKQSKNFRADLIDSIRTTIGWTRQDQQLLSDTPLLSGASDVLRRFGGDQARYSRFENIVTEIALQQNSVASSTTAFDAETLARVAPDHEKLTTRLVPPAERLRLGGMYVPYTKQQRVSWFLANLDTDDA